MSVQADFSKHARVLEEVLAMYKHEASELELMLWRDIMAKVSFENFSRFMLNYCRSNRFAPMPVDAEKALHPSMQDALIAFEALRSQVATTGPYQVPEFEDSALVGAIQTLGGWSKVNAELPDPSNDFAFRAYRQRFDSAYKFAANQQMVLGASYAPAALVAWQPGMLHVEFNPSEVLAEEPLPAQSGVRHDASN